MQEKTALIAMSGGVDSSVAAYLVQQAGYRCAGAILHMVPPSLLGQAEGSVCGSAQSIEDARQVAQRLGIELDVIPAADAFRENVVEPFIRCYAQGGTPNPCITCNKHMKFAYLLEAAQQQGFDKVVTGHYARIREEKGRFVLYKAADPGKDQTYFLAGLTQQQLSRCLFPLGELTKDQVRAIAQQQGFLNAKKRDSQDICFIPDGDYPAFIARYTGETPTPGDFLDLEGNPVGRHSGAIAYTIGQRKGLGLAMGQPVYVCSKDMVKNTVTVGPDPALFTDTLLAKDWNWLPFERLTESMQVQAKVRSRHLPQEATVYPEDGGFARVVFREPQRAITPGQAVVLYQGDLVVGSGTII